MEKESRIQLGCALFTCLTMVMLLCVVGVVFGLGLNLNSFAFSAPSLPGGPTAPRGPAVDRIALVGEDGNVYIVDRNGQSRIAITDDAALEESAEIRRAYVFPNWSPNSSQLAFVGVSTVRNGTAALYAVDAKGGKLNELFTSGDALPIYLNWSPDSKRVAFLSQDDNDALTLNSADADGSNLATLGAGSPLYFSWAPDSQTLLTHIGGSRRQSADATIGLHSLAAAGSPQKLALAPANFLAPAWSPNGKEILSALLGTSSGNDELIVTDSKGANPRTIARYNGSIYFSWSPDGSHIAYLHSIRSGTTPRTELHVVRADGTGDQLATEDSVAVFFWSPDGKQIAYLVRPRGEQGELRFAANGAQQPTDRFTWKVVNLDNRQIATLSTFVPTDSFAALLPYFDQYAQSVRLWSPDSKSLVYAAVERDSSESVYVIDIAGSGEARRIADGGIGVWSWQ